jgi:hypothetical protein
MGEGLGGCNGCEGLERRFAEGSARSGEDDATDFGMSSGAEALVYGVVLAVDGEQFPAGFRSGGHHEFTGGDENFLIGQSDGAAEFHRFVGGFESNNTDGGGNDDVGAGVSADGQHALASMVDGWESDSLFAEAAGDFVGESGNCDGDYLGMMALNLGQEFVEIGASGQGEDSELIGEGFDDGKSLAADRTGGTEDGERTHGVFSCQ